MKKTLLLLAIPVLSFILLSSCDQVKSLTGGKKMDSKSTVNEIRDLYKKIDTDEFKPIRVSWHEKEELSNEALVVLITMINDDLKVYDQSFALNTTGGGKFDTNNYYSGKYSSVPENWVRLEDLDPDNVISNIEKAKAMIPDEYDYEGLSVYEIATDYIKDELSHKFTVNVTERGKSEVKSAGRTVIEYYELEFKVDSDGNVELLD